MRRFGRLLLGVPLPVLGLMQFFGWCAGTGSAGATRTR